MSTVKLLTSVDGAPAGALLHRDLVYLRQLVAENKATWDLSNGFDWPKASDLSAFGPYDSVAQLEAAYPAANYPNGIGIVAINGAKQMHFSSNGKWSAVVGANYNPLTGEIIESAGGITFRQSSIASRIKKVAALGDSLTENGYMYGFDLRALILTMGGGAYAAIIGDSECPSGAGTLTLTAQNTLTWTPNGGTAGVEVDASRDGKLYVPGPLPLQGIWISWNPSINALRPGTSSITIPANGLQRFGWQTTGYMTWFMALSWQGYEWALAPAFEQNGQQREALHGQGGATSQAILASAWQWTQTTADEWHVMIGRNDISGSVPYATIISNLSAIYALLRLKSPRLRLYSITPKDTDTVTQRKTRAAVNRWIANYCRVMANCLFVDAAAAVTDPSNGNFLSGYASDGTHTTGTGAYYIGLASVVAGDDVAMNSPYISAYDDVFDATYNPYGNLLATAGMGVWNGTAGGQLGSTAGGQLGTGWSTNTLSGTYTSAVNSQIARTDGVSGVWQQIAPIWTATGDHALQSTATNYAATVGQAYEAICEYNIVASSGGITKAGIEIVPVGVSARVCWALLGDLPNLSSTVKLVLRTPRYYVPPGVTSIYPQSLSKVAASGALTAQYGRIALRPVM